MRATSTSRSTKRKPPPRAAIRRVACVAACLLAGAALAQPAGQIAYLSGEDASGRTVAVWDLATGVPRVVGAGAGDGPPKWSPDGGRIAHTAARDGGRSLRVIDLAKSEARWLRHAHAWNGELSWRGDGAALAYVGGGDARLGRRALVYDLARDEETAWANGEAHWLQAAWMPNLDLLRALDPDAGAAWTGFELDVLLREAFSEGALIAVGLVPDAGPFGTDLFLVTRTQRARILPLILPGSARYTEWRVTPDALGRQIAFESNDGGFRDLFVLSGRGLHNVTNHHAADWRPVWSPDGRWLAFESFRGGRRGVYRVFPETARIDAVVSAETHDAWAPAWSPDGAWIAYVSDAAGYPAIHAATPEGGQDRRVTPAGETALAPAWRPELHP